MKKSVCLLILTTLISLDCFSQSSLTVTADSIATTLAQTITGSGVTVSNASLNCNGQAVGNFSYSGTNLGLTNGIILTTGMADSAVYHPNSFGFYTPPSTAWNTTFNDPNLTAIEPLAKNDVCIVAFDFVPICNSLSITFVFASSEYDGFVCGTYNDAFGIFLTGTNPAGGNYTGFNIATLPNGIPVTIDNVNDVGTCAPDNSIYYVNNLDANSNDLNQDIAYPGYTIPITSVTSVSPCTTYHMEIAIADAGDWSYDSAVFIEGNSVSCTNTPTVTAASTAENCGTLGSATVTVTNYTATPTYTWQPGGATTASISNLTPGTYSCIVGLQSGCGIVTQTITTVVGSSGAAFTYTTTTQNPLCDNGTNGSAGVLVSGGSAPYTYTWTSIPAQNTATTTATLAAGTYSVNVTDNIGCIGTTTVVLTNPPPIIATVTTSPTTCTGSTGIATASVTSGGTAPYTFAWNTTPPQIGQTISNLAQGTYTVGVLDVNSCTATATGLVGVQGFTWSPSATWSNPLCVGYANGSATVSISNPGTSTFTYSWSTTPAQTNTVATNLAAGTYSVFVTDNNGCIDITTATLTNPPPITATVNTSPTICTGSVGTATAIVLGGGTAPFNYTWTTNPVQTGSVSVNLAQGSYSVVILDANNCSVITTGSVQSTGFTWVPVVTSSPTKCFGSANGTATVTITNPGNSIFTYAWVPTAQTNSVATNLSIGNYTITVTDNNSCVSTVHVNITQPTQLVLGAQTTPAICTSNNGTAFVSIFGGTGPYTSLWQTNPPQIATTVTGLAQGQYNVTVTDANNCVAVITALVNDTTDLTLTATSNPDLCSKGVGQAIAHPKGGQPYTYIWSTNPVQNTQTADSLVVGSYSVNVTDAYGCTASASTTIINKNDVLNAEFIITPSGIVYAENPVVLNLIPNSGWIADSLAYLSNGVLITKNPFPYTFPQYGNYTATYYFNSIHGCKDSAIYEILVKDYMTLYIPNSFTPNGDGENDHFEAQGTFINSFQMNIYDRWGVLVTTLNNITNAWDGNKNGGPAPEDVYVYKGTASDIFGNLLNFNGQINLIR
jgi:gliding motility-associated-like protein